ncbi:MAG: transglutaminase-like domain-containing protein [Planctomycetota bacterium]|nr:transglutaminase-like domain-containing protein [Planctomycetota bacterium]
MRHLVLSTLIVLALVLATGTGTARADERPNAKAVVALLKELRAELEAPGLTVADAAANLDSAKAAIDFVRDEVTYMPYGGAYHGAAGTLRTRVANSVDKATLLHALLTAMKVEARLVRADFPKGAKPHHAKGRTKRPAALAKLQKLLQVKAREADTKGSQALLKTLRNEVGSSLSSLRAVLAGLGEAARLEGAAAGSEGAQAPKDWVWVQAKLDGTTWTDIDPVFPTRARPQTATAYAPTSVQVTIELLADDTPVLTWTDDAAALFGHDAEIQLLPGTGKVKDAETPAKVKTWVALLRIGSSSTLGKPFAPGGETIAPTPATRGLFGNTPAKPGQIGAKTLRLQVRFVDERRGAAGTRTYGRTIQRFDAGFDPQQLVANYRMTFGVADVPFHVETARLIDEMLDTRRLVVPLKKGEAAPTSAQSERGLSSRSARVLNALFFLQPALVSKGVELEWTGPAVVVESVSLKQVGDKLKTVARIDIWHQAFTPKAGSARARRAEWGLATLAVEGHLLDTVSVNNQLLSAHGPVVRVADGAKRLAGDEIARGIQNQGGIVLSSTTTRDVTWSLRPNGELLGTLSTHGTAAKGGERMNDAIAAGVGGVAGGMVGATGNPAGMLVGGIAAYLNELRKVWGDVTSVLDAVGKTIETGDQRYVLEAIGAYDGDMARRLGRAFAEGAVRGYAESVIGAGARPLLGGSGNPYGPTVGDRIVDGALAGGLSAPQDLPIVSDVVSAAGDVVFGR